MKFNFNKKNSLLIAMMISAMSFSVTAQVFVNKAATGSNDGSSWANAYTGLQMALDNATTGSQIWVAKGTYSPGSAATDFFTVLTLGQEIYGGFAGTETMLSQRDFTTNKTILSGDVAGNDITDDFTTNRSDNNVHVMYIDATITNTTIIDGFYIEHGQTADATGTGDNRRGGGILSYGSPIVRNCTFSQNYGYYGAGMYPRGTTANSILVENCDFSKNSGTYGGGLYLVAGGTFNDCTFNSNLGSYGAGAYAGGDRTTFNHCDFTNLGDANARGAGIYASTSIALNSCLFENNNGIWGCAIYATDVTIVDSCEFKNNVAVNNGGGILMAFQAVVTITNTNFEANVAGNGGALYAQNDSTMVFVDNCYFFGNSAGSGSGGGFFSLAGPIIEINHSEFDLNLGEYGGGVAYSSSDSKLIKDRLTIMNSKFHDNIAGAQGGAINISNTDSVFVTNCLINDNSANGVGTGGAIAFNSSDTLPVYALLMNSTIANNIGLLANNIASWQDDASFGDVKVVFQNTIMYDQLANNYAIEAGTPTVISNGGNISNDNTLSAIFTNTNDLNVTDAVFVDEANRNYRLGSTSPCIDAGIATNAPLEDIDGMLRVGAPDMGAIEYSINIGTKIVENLDNGFDIFPNPIAESFTFELNNDWVGDVQMTLTNSLGQVVQHWTVSKTGETLTKQIAVAQLPAGNYILSARQGNAQVNEMMIKL